jgi:hypothetical protein
MKSLFAVFFSVVSICAAFAFDEASLNAKRADNVTKKWYGEVGKYDYLLSLKGGKPVSYDAMKAGIREKIVAAYTTAGVKMNPSVEVKIDQVALSLAFWSFPEFKSDAIKDTKALTANPQFYIYVSSSEVNDSIRYNALVEGIATNKLSRLNVLKSIDFIIQHATTLEEAKAKADLKRLNRVLSPKLISDKANWEPIVAKIRTALETY